MMGDRPTPWERVLSRRADPKAAEAGGVVADSQEVRLALMQEFHSGRKTLEEVQAELAKVKRNAKKNGKVTREQAYRGRKA